MIMAHGDGHQRRWFGLRALSAMALAMNGVQAAEEQPVPPDSPGPIPPSVVEETRNNPSKTPVARLGVAVKHHRPTPENAPGLQVALVVPGSPAEKAGLLPNDVITHFNDQILFAPFQLEMLVKRSEVGARVRLTYYREDPSETRQCDPVLDASIAEAIPTHPEAVLADRFRVTGRVVRVTTGGTTISLSTRQRKAYLTVSDQTGIVFDATVETETDIPDGMLVHIKRVAELRQGKWRFKLPRPLPLRPPVQLAPDEGPKAPAPESD